MPLPRSAKWSEGACASWLSCSPRSSAKFKRCTKKEVLLYRNKVLRLDGKVPGRMKPATYRRGRVCKRNWKRSRKVLGPVELSYLLVLFCRSRARQGGR